MTTAREPQPPWQSHRAADVTTVHPLWQLPARSGAISGKEAGRMLGELVRRVAAAPGMTLFDAVESGVPTVLLHVIAQGTGQPMARAMDLVGVSTTTFRRKEEAGEPLPDVVGHRVMGFLRLAATLRRLLQESGDAARVAGFDLETWLGGWMHETLPELGHKSPATLLRNPEGQRAIEQVLERMRGGLPA